MSALIDEAKDLNDAIVCEMIEIVMLLAYD